MTMAANVVYHDHCYVMPIKQGATSLLFPSVSGLNTRIQGGKVIVVTSPDLPPVPDNADKPEEEELNEGIAHDHGYYHSTSGSEESQDEKPPERGCKSKSLITFDLPQENKCGTATTFGPTSSHMSFPDCQFSTLPAQIFAQDEEEGTTTVVTADGNTSTKVDITEDSTTAQVSEHSVRVLTKETSEGKKRQRKMGLTIPKRPPPESATPTRKGTRQRKPSTKVKEMLEEVEEEKKSPTRKRKAVISIARPDLVPYTPSESEINTTTIHTILKSLPTALKERSKIIESAEEDSDVFPATTPKKLKKMPEGNAPQKGTPKKPGARKRKKEEDSTIEKSEILSEDEPLSMLTEVETILPSKKIYSNVDIPKLKPVPSTLPTPSAFEEKIQPEKRRRGRPPKIKIQADSKEKDAPNKKTMSPEKKPTAAILKPALQVPDPVASGSKQQDQSIVDQVLDVIKEIKQVEKITQVPAKKTNAKTVKAIVVESALDVVKQDSETTVMDKVQEPETTPKKRGRGRPPKAKPAAETPTSKVLKKPVPEQTTARISRTSINKAKPQQEPSKPQKEVKSSDSIPKKIVVTETPKQVATTRSSRVSSRRTESPATEKLIPEVTTPKISRGRGRPPSKQPATDTDAIKSIPTAKRRKSKASEEDSASEDLTIRFIPSGEVSKSGNHWGSVIPSDLLLRVFKLVITAEGPLPFISRLAKVCRLWYEVGRHPSLWSQVDLSQPCVRKVKKSITWLCRHRMAATTDLNLNGWSNLTDEDLLIVVRQCRSLDTLSLSGCNKLSSDSMRTIATQCKQLTRIDLSDCWAKSGQYDKSHESICFFVKTVGTRLISFNLSTNSVTQPDELMEAFMMHCPNLEELDFSNCLFGNYELHLSLERFQEACPMLKHFRLAKSLFKVKQPSHKELAKCPGFVNLESLDISRNANNASKLIIFDDAVLERMLRNAFELKHLDVSGCHHITCAGLEVLPIVSLKTLYLARCRAVTQPAIVDVILKWGFSLQDIDLSGNSIDETILLRVVDGCPNLKRLDISGCRGLPWSMRKEHLGDTVVTELRDLLMAQAKDA